MRSVGRIGMLAVAAWALAGTAVADASVTFAPNEITVSTAGASAVVTRHPFRIAYRDGGGHTVLAEVPPASTPSLALPVPGPILGGSVASAPALYAPLAFTVGGEVDQPQPGFEWTGDIALSARTGIEYSAVEVLSARAAGDGVRMTVSTSDPSGRMLIVTLASAPGAALRLTATPSPSAGVAAVSDSFASGPDEAFHGFGGRHDTLDQHRQAFYSWTEEENVGAGAGQPVANAIPGGGGLSYMFPSGPAAAYYPQPLFFSSRPYGFLVDQPDLARFRMDSDRSDAWQADVTAPSLTYVVAPGDGAKAIDTLTSITGRQPLPPAWGLGPMLDRALQFANPTAPPYTTLVAQDMVNIDRYRPPLTAYRLEGWDTLSLAQDAAIVAQLRARGLHPLAYFRAYVASGAHGGGQSVMDAALAGHYVATNALGQPYEFVDPEGGLAALIDYSNPAAVHWWQGRLKAAVDLGFDGFMQDFGEQVVPDMHFADGSSGMAMHNRYPVLFHQATRALLDAYERSHPGRTLFYFTRAGYTGDPGTAAYESANFPGDETTDWSRSSGLASIVTDMLNRAVGGAYGFGTDIGGYADVHTPPTSKELLLRWAEAAALMPVFRLHGSTLAGTHVPWNYDRQTIHVYNNVSALHLAAAPLILRLWEQARRDGMPPTRPLWLASPGDAVAAQQDQEWLLGPDVLVAPVVVQGASSRSVYFPAGCWQDPRNGAVHLGPASATVAAPLDTLPYFFHCGTQPFAVGGAAAAVRGCAPGRSIRFAIHQDQGPAVRVRVYVGRRLVASVRGRLVRSVTISRPGAARFSVQVVVDTARGRRVISRRTFAGCAKSAPLTVVHRRRG